MPFKPPLLVVANDILDGTYSSFDLTRLAENLKNAEDGQVLTCPFPVTLYHYIDGIWLPVSDLGAFHSPSAAQAEPEKPREWLPCDDGD